MSVSSRFVTASAPIALSMLAVAVASPAAQNAQQLCPPCAAVARAQSDLDKIPAEALADRTWALGDRGIRLIGAALTAPGGLPGAGATIVQIDTGITDHPLLPLVSPADGPDAAGLDVSSSDGLFGPGQTNKDPLLTGFLRFPGHGTKTSSVIIARPDARYAGMAGAARGARLIPVRATQGVLLFPGPIAELDADQHRVARALNEAAMGANGLFRHTVDVISMSLGAWPPTPDLCAAVKAATDAGVIVIAAAGNEIKRTKYPAKCPTAIAVAGSTFEQEPWSGSAGSAEVVVAAPAEGVWTASVVAGAFCFEASSGTSFATALVASMAAEWIADRKRRGVVTASPAEEFRTALKESARPWTGPKAAAWSRTFGAGIADMTRLMARGSRP